MTVIELERVNPALPGVMAVNIPHEFTAFGATHTLFEGDLVERLGLPSLGSLSVTSRETYCRNGVWGPIISDSDRYFAVTSGEFLAVVAKPNTGNRIVMTIKPVIGLLVPSGYAVALQTIHDNRSSHLVVTKRYAAGVLLPFDTPEFTDCWNSTESDPVRSEFDPRLSHPSQ